MIIGQALRWVLILALAAGTLAAGAVGSAERGGAECGGPVRLYGDGNADLATGVPGESLRSVEVAGAVQVIYGSAAGLTSKDAQLVSLASAGLAGVRDEAEVRRVTEDLNERIRGSHRRKVDGPALALRPVDVEATVAECRNHTMR